MSQTNHTSSGRKSPQRASHPSSRKTAKAQRRPRPQTRSAKPTRKRRKLTPQQVAQARTIASFRKGGVIASAAVLGCCAIVGLLLFARPTVSKVENRNLTAFPTLTWESFWNGSFFSDVDLWYSDTYPLREQMVAANKTLDALHGIPTQTQMVGGTKQADELPPTDQQADGSSKTGTIAKKDYSNVEVPTEEAMAEAVQDQITSGLYVKGDAAYNIYYFSQEAVQEYADTINTLAEELDGTATVYSVVAPNASGIVLSEQEMKDLGGTNQEDAIDYFYSLYSNKVHSVDTVSYLKKHTDEYLFYRTDHHWTALGAYYGYEAFCAEKGIEPEDRDDLAYKDMGDFLGSFYYELNSDAMAANPDHMETWTPNATNTLTLYGTDGSAEEYNIITDTSEHDPFGKDMTFIMSDQPLEKIANPKLSDGSSCLIIKDSFGDFFAPWIVDHYETVWIADFRYFEGTYLDFVAENDIKDVIVVNNVSLAGGGTVAPALLGKM